jgi:hypothetical protein
MCPSQFASLANRRAAAYDLNTEKAPTAAASPLPSPTTLDPNSINIPRLGCAGATFVRGYSPSRELPAGTPSLRTPTLTSPFQVAIEQSHLSTTEESSETLLTAPSPTVANEKAPETPFLDKPAADSNEQSIIHEQQLLPHDDDDDDEEESTSDSLPSNTDATTDASTDEGTDEDTGDSESHKSQAGEEDSCRSRYRDVVKHPERRHAANAQQEGFTASLNDVAVRSYVATGAAPVVGAGEVAVADNRTYEREAAEWNELWGGSEWKEEEEDDDDEQQGEQQQDEQKQEKEVATEVIGPVVQNQALARNRGTLPGETPFAFLLRRLLEAFFVLVPLLWVLRLIVLFLDMILGEEFLMMSGETRQLLLAFTLGVLIGFEMRGFRRW